MFAIMKYGLGPVFALFPLLSFAQGLQVVRPIEGYTCMSLNLTESQLLNNTKPVLVRAEPTLSSPQVGTAGATVAVLQPAHPVNGFVQILFPTGQHVWINFSELRPWRSSSNPKAQCVPSWLSNGKPGFDYK